MKLYLSLGALAVMAVLSVMGQIADPTAKTVISRYDYSSPRASLQSFQQALRDRDSMGIYIHWWYTMPADAPMKKAHQSLADMVQKTEEAFAHDPDMKNAGVQMAEQLDYSCVAQDRIENHDGAAKPPPSRLTITTMEYVRDVAALTNRNGVVTSTMLVRWRSAGRYALVRAQKSPSQQYWWVVFPGGYERINPFPDEKLQEKISAYVGKE